MDEQTLFKYKAGLFALTGSLQGSLASALLNQGEDAALSQFEWLYSIYGEKLYLEVQRPLGVQAWNRVQAFFEELAQKYPVRQVAAHEIYLLHKNQRTLQKVLHCIENNITLGEVKEKDLPPEDSYFKGLGEMLQAFQDFPSACEETLNITKACQVEFTLEDEKGRKIYHLPQTRFEDNKSSADHLRELARSGLEKKRQAIKALTPPPPPQKTFLSEKAYKDRLEQELDIITQMGFSDYFLIVRDFISWAKKQEIPVGPGRGSGAASLVSYCLGITDLDPLEYNLFFERFLNPERISMPDFDIDFCPQGRDRVLGYVTQKYGADRVAQIITYGKFQARAAFRDVGRALGMSFSEVDAMAKLIPHRQEMTLQKAMEIEPRLKEEMEKEAGFNELMQLALELEGHVRQQGVHAAGVVVSEKALTHDIPLCRGKEGEVVSQYDMNALQEIGLVKFDFLGLKTLTHIHSSLKLIEKNHHKKIHPEAIPISDPAIYKLICSGNTAGIFQLESSGMSNAISQIQPGCFEDIVAITSLYRPGPMEMIPEFAKRKRGKVKIAYLLPELEPILKETYGIMVYQEQVIRIAVEIAGYSAGEADILRRAMGKKKKEEMARQQKRFMEGTIKKGHPQQKVKELFQLMDKFASYGFNKAHAAAYCVISAQTAWIKHYYPTEFFATLLSLEMNNTDQIIHYVQDAKANGITLHAPHVNQSGHKFTIPRDRHIYFGLGAIKGISKGVAESIVKARNKEFKEGFPSLRDFFRKVDLQKLHKAPLESFIYAGALDHFGKHRAQLIKDCPLYMQYATRKQKEERSGQMSLLSFVSDSEEDIKSTPVKPWSAADKLAYEKQVLGLYLTDHPLKSYEKICGPWTNTFISSLLKNQDMVQDTHQGTKKGIKQGMARPTTNSPQRQGKKFRLLVITSKIKELLTKKDQKRMAFVSIEDRTGMIEVLAFPEVFTEEESKLKSGQPLLIEAQVNNRSRERENIGPPTLVLDKTYTVGTFLNNIKKITFHLDHFEDAECKRLHTLLKNHKGNIPTYLQLNEKKEKVWEMEITSTQISSQLFENIYKEFGRNDFVQISP